MSDMSKSFFNVFIKNSCLGIHVLEPAIFYIESWLKIFSKADVHIIFFLY